MVSLLDFPIYALDLHLSGDTLDMTTYILHYHLTVAVHGMPRCLEQQQEATYSFYCDTPQGPQGCPTFFLPWYLIAFHQLNLPY